MQRDTNTWLTDLQSDEEQQAAALDDLREILMRILPKALSRWLDPADPNFTALMEDIAQETLLRVLSRLDTFEGRSKFTTWVYTIAVRIGLSKLRLRKWQEASLESLESNSNTNELPFKRFASPTNSPEIMIEQSNALSLVMTAIDEELTPYQRSVMSAVIFEGIPMDVVAQRLGKDRNTLYKVMHDARLKIRQHLELSGHAPLELLALFNR
jgi:RNA polymerase sigma-70 factor, ECF subfamily